MRRKKRDEIDFLLSDGAVLARSAHEDYPALTEKLLGSPDYPTCRAVLTEAGLCAPDEDCFAAIERAEQELYAFLAEQPDEECGDILRWLRAFPFVVELKRIVKSYVFFESTDLNSSDPLISRILREKDFSLLGDILENACEQAIAQAGANRDPQTVDLLLDKALFAYRASIAEQSGIPLLTALNAGEADRLNLLTVLRLRRMDSNAYLARQYFFPGGTLEEPLLLALLEGKESARTDLLGTPYGDLSSLLTDSSVPLSEAEHAINAIDASGLAEARREPLGADAIIFYALDTLASLQTLRTVLTGKKVGLATEDIRKRIL